MVHLDIELVSHPFMSVCEAFLFAMCLQQQYDFYCKRYDHRLKCVDTNFFTLWNISIFRCEPWMFHSYELR